MSSANLHLCLPSLTNILVSSLPRITLHFFTVFPTLQGTVYPKKDLNQLKTPHFLAKPRPNKSTPPPVSDTPVPPLLSSPPLPPLYIEMFIGEQGPIVHKSLFSVFRFPGKEITLRNDDSLGVEQRRTSLSWWRVYALLQCKSPVKYLS